MGRKIPAVAVIALFLFPLLLPPTASGRIKTTNTTS